MATDERVAWFWSNDKEAEQWGGPLTREKAIQEARANIQEEGQPAFICFGSQLEPTDFFPTVERLLEDAQESAYDEVGEHAEGWTESVSIEAGKELDAFISAWAKKHLKPLWQLDGEPEDVTP